MSEHKNENENLDDTLQSYLSELDGSGPVEEDNQESSTELTTNQNELAEDGPIEGELCNEPEPQVDISKYLDTLEDVTQEILTSCRSDRKEAQRTINLCQDAIDDAQANGRAPERMWVDGLVKIIEVKANINTTAVKIMEANAKMLSATKAGVQINQFNANNSSTVADTNLEELLSEPFGDEDQY